MGTKTIVLAFFLLLSCSSTRFIDSWRNKGASFAPKKLLVIGMTENQTARRIFEEKLRLALNERGVNAQESLGIIDREFTESQQSIEAIEGMTQKVQENGFDGVIITAVKGVDDKIDYRPGYYDVHLRWYRFGRYWYAYQDVYHTPDYYSKYKVYHLETAVYNLAVDDDRSLVWVGSFDVVNPQRITSSVDDYVERIMEQLERENLVRPL